MNRTDTELVEEHYRKVDRIVRLVKTSDGTSPWVIDCPLGAGVVTSLYHALGGCERPVQMVLQDEPVPASFDASIILLCRRVRDLNSTLEDLFSKGLVPEQKVVLVVHDISSSINTNPCLINKCCVASY